MPKNHNFPTRIRTAVLRYRNSTTVSCVIPLCRGAIPNWLNFNAVAVAIDIAQRYSTFRSGLADHTELTELTELSDLTELTDRTDLAELPKVAKLSKVTQLSELTELSEPTKVTELYELVSRFKVSEVPDRLVWWSKNVEKINFFKSFWKPDN